MSAPSSRQNKPPDWQWRCVECGDGSKLTACAYAVASGPLHPNGRELLTHDDVSETELAVDSVQCSEHPGAELHWKVDGVWMTGHLCGNCNQEGRAPHPKYGYLQTCPVCNGEHWREVPIEDACHA